MGCARWRRWPGLTWTRSAPRGCCRSSRPRSKAWTRSATWTSRGSSRPPASRSSTWPPMPDDDALAYLSAAELGRLYRARELSPVEATRAHLERIGRYDAPLRCFVVVTAESALAEAQRAEAELRRGEDRGPLHGI